MLSLTSSVSPAPAAQDAVSFGAVLSLSGRLSLSAGIYRKAYDLTAAWINEHGGIVVGGKSYRVEVAYEDDGGDPRATSRLAEKLVASGKARFLLGPYGADMVAAAAAVARRHGLPLVHAGSSGSFSDGLVFGLLPSAESHFASVFELMKGLSPRPKKIGLVYTDDVFDVQAAEGIRRSAARLGFSLVVDERHRPGEKDFAPLASRIKVNLPDALLIAGYPEDARSILRRLKEEKLAPPLVCLGAGLTEGRYRQEFAADGESLCGVTFWSPEIDPPGDVFGSGLEFAKKYLNTYDERPDYHVAAAAAVLIAYAKAISAAGSLSPEKVGQALVSLDAETIYGRLAFGDDGRITGGTFIVQIQGGKLERIYPLGKAKPVYPAPSWADRRMTWRKISDIDWYTSPR